MNPRITRSFTLEKVDCGQRPNDTHPKLMHVWQGTYSDWITFVRENVDDPAFAAGLRSLADDRSFSGITIPRSEWLESGIFPNAVTAFESAVTRLHADRLQPGTVRPAVSGGTWVVPLVLSGHPMPARIRERTRLPPKNIRFGITVPAHRDWNRLSDSLAKLAHGAWEYLQAGGAITVEAWHCTHYDSPLADGACGLIVKIKAPLTSKAGFACAMSVQVKRGLTLALACGAAGRRQSLPMCYVRGLHALTGNAQNDAQSLAAVGIKG